MGHERLPTSRRKRMPHGDFSDITAFICAAIGGTTLYDPTLIFYTAYGPMKPAFDTPPIAETLFALKIIGGLLLMVFPMFYVVRWNKINGKAAMLGLWIAAANMIYHTYNMDGGVLILRPWYALAGIFLLASLHFGFNANPMLTSAMLLEKEKAKAAKAAKD